LLEGSLVEIIGTPGDLGYIFRGSVAPASDASPAAAALLDGATQFVAQLAVTEPANTAQLTVVFLSPTAAAVAADPTATEAAAGTGSDVEQPTVAAGTGSDAQQAAAAGTVGAPTAATESAIAQVAAPWTATAQSVALSAALGATGILTIGIASEGLSVPSLAGPG
jgi:hypothetical protein